MCECFSRTDLSQLSIFSTVTGLMMRSYMLIVPHLPSGKAAAEQEAKGAAGEAGRRDCKHGGDAERGLQQHCQLPAGISCLSLQDIIPWVTYAIVSFKCRTSAQY